MGVNVMSVKNEELRSIIARFAESGWDLIDEPSKAWLEGRRSNEDLLPILVRADQECGSCGCEFDPLYKRAIELLQMGHA
jgi:hypothetical protein